VSAAQPRAYRSAAVGTRMSAGAIGRWRNVERRQWERAGGGRRVGSGSERVVGGEWSVGEQKSLRNVSIYVVPAPRWPLATGQCEGARRFLGAGGCLVVCWGRGVGPPCNSDAGRVSYTAYDSTNMNPAVAWSSVARSSGGCQPGCVVSVWSQKRVPWYSSTQSDIFTKHNRDIFRTG
jgi:hypothetical protein